MNCKDCIHYERCTVVHCFEYNKYNITVDFELEEHWSNNPDDIAIKKHPKVEITMKDCYAFEHNNPEAYIAKLNEEHNQTKASVAL